MPQKPSRCGINYLQSESFVERCDGHVARAIQGVGNILEGLEFDDVERTATTSTTDTYTFRKSATDVATLVVTYEDATKEVFIRAQLTRL